MKMSEVRKVPDRGYQMFSGVCAAGKRTDRADGHRVWPAGLVARRCESARCRGGRVGSGGARAPDPVCSTPVDQGVIDFEAILEQLDAAGSAGQISVPVHPMIFALELGTESVVLGASVSPLSESPQLGFGIILEATSLQDLSRDVTEVSSFDDAVAPA